MENGIGRFNGREWEPSPQGSWENEAQARRQVCDFIAGMTDRYAMRIYEHIFLPKPWNATNY